MQHENRSSHRSCSIKKLFLKISQYSQESLFNKVGGLKACNFVEKSLQHRYTYEILKNIYFTEYLQTVLLLFEVPITGWKVSKYGVFSAPYSVRMQENRDQKKLCIWTLFMQWIRSTHVWMILQRKAILLLDFKQNIFLNRL